MRILLLLFFLTILSLSLAQSLQISLSLNITIAEWKEAINASGYVKDLAGNPVIANVSVRVNEEEKCFVQTDSNGFYSCEFFAPSQIGNYKVIAWVNGEKSNEVELKVIYSYGSTKFFKNVISIYFPLLIQDLNGKVHKVNVNLRVWG